ncbi:LysE family translocator [Aliiroseovarius subalbicans]|uniref:LysE family translocator n=1 Tax=Aliiroseovarius subalbicans TaxID=2925840 RepID=UPI001F5AE8AF|nr:LysE family translocator [Aliiroseovarius subalbicans]MCI2399298.1 LysE family translocator [Aliiroseovarius subalbicans]
MLFQWDFWVFVGALALAAATPGPGLAAILATVMAWGARRTAWFCVGMILGDLVWLTLSLGGLAVVASRIPAVFLVIKWAGVAYLLFLAIKTWRAPVRLDPAQAAPREKGRAARVLAGWTVTMGNPKAMLFYLALLPSILHAERLTLDTAMWLGAAIVIVLTLVFAAYVTAADKARQAFTSPRSLKRFNMATAGALSGAAVWIASR